MTSIVITGIYGRMGRAIANLAIENGGFTVCAGIDKVKGVDLGFPVFESFEEVKSRGICADVIIDFSNPSILVSMLEYAQKSKTSIVLATTGLSQQEVGFVLKASENVAIFRSANMSVGINVMAELCKKASLALGKGYDIEIIEKHHNKKVDSPSGTALLLADELNSVNDNTYKYVYDRSTTRNVRQSDEIGIHGVRGGSIVGEHEVIFAGEQEIVTISHSAMSRDVFADGSLRAAEFLKGKKHGIYSMTDLIKGALD